MKNLLNVLFILLFISSCSDTDNSTFPEINDEEENNTEKIIPLKLANVSAAASAAGQAAAGSGGGSGGKTAAASTLNSLGGVVGKVACRFICRFWLISQ